VNERRTGCGVLPIQLMAARLSKRGDRPINIELEGPFNASFFNVPDGERTYKPRIAEKIIVPPPHVSNSRAVYSDSPTMIEE
jgi:hypothetical protein